MLTKSGYCRTFSPVMNPLTFLPISYTLMYEIAVGVLVGFISVKTNPRFLCQEVPVGRPSLTLLLKQVIKGF